MSYSINFGNDLIFKYGPFLYIFLSSLNQESSFSLNDKWKTVLEKFSLTKEVLDLRLKRHEALKLSTAIFITSVNKNDQLQGFFFFFFF